MTDAPVTAGAAAQDPTWPDVLTTLMSRADLSVAEAAWAMDRVMSGEATPAQLAGLLVALRTKGETVEELRGLADTMLAHARRFEVQGPSLDIVGTGGDRAMTVNISTMASVVCAGAGVPVVKHGNRAASSRSGSADVIEALGIRLDQTPAEVEEVLGQAGITFCFAQTFHPSMRHSGVVRRELGVSTVFNVLGPLTNPAQPRYAAIGVADQRLAPLLAGVLRERGKVAAVFRGGDGLDELTTATTSHVWWTRAGRLVEHELDPLRLGVPRHPLETLRGADAEHNAGVARRVFAGEGGPVRDAVLLNAGMALAVAAADEQDVWPEAEADLDDLVRAGMGRAAAAIDGGHAAAVIERWVAATTR